MSHTHQQKSDTKSSEPTHTPNDNAAPASPVEAILARQPATWTHHDVLYLQRTLGNQQTQRLLQRDEGGETGGEDTDSKKKSRKPAPLPDTAQGWNEEKAKADLATFKKRLQPMPQLNNDYFTQMIDKYVDALRRGDEADIKRLIGDITGYLKQRQAFQVQKDLYIQHSQGATTSMVPPEIHNAAQKQVEEGYLWSKMSQFPAITAVEGKEAISLEASAAGSLFDGLTFGRKFGDELLRAQWSKVSAAFASGLRGVVHVMVYGGLHPRSEFTKTEMPIIKKKMEQGVIVACYIYLFDYKETMNDMAYQRTITIQKPGDWNAVPKVDETDEWIAKQQIVDAKNTHRYKAKAVFEQIKNEDLMATLKETKK